MHAHSGEHVRPARFTPRHARPSPVPLRSSSPSLSLSTVPSGYPRRHIYTAHPPTSRTRIKNKTPCTPHTCIHTGCSMHATGAPDPSISVILARRRAPRRGSRIIIFALFPLSLFAHTSPYSLLHARALQYSRYTRERTYIRRKEPAAAVRRYASAQVARLSAANSRFSPGFPSLYYIPRSDSLADSNSAARLISPRPREAIDG